MLSMQTPVFLTEPPQMQDSPTPRRRKKRTRRRHLALESRSGGWDSGRESGRDSPRSVDLSLAPKRVVRGPPDRVYRGQELDLTIVPEKLSSSEKQAKGQDTSRSVRSIFEPWCDFQQCGILTCVDSDDHVQSPFKLRNFKWCSVSSLTLIE